MRQARHPYGAHDSLLPPSCAQPSKITPPAAHQTGRIAALFHRRGQKALKFLDFEIEARPETAHAEDFVAKHAGAVFLIEATGSVGSITIDKGRQLMHWVTDSEVENCHGLLVGNAFSKEPPENRPPTLNHHIFTRDLKEYAEKHGFSLLDTTELFRIVCAKLAGQPVAMDLVCDRLHRAGLVTFAERTAIGV